MAALRNLNVATGSAGTAETRPPSQEGKAPLNGLFASLAELHVASFLPFLRYGADRMGPVGIIGVSLCLCALVAFITATAPLDAKVAAQQAELDALRSDPVQPGENRAGSTTQRNARRLVDELPARDDLPGVLGQVFAIATESGLSLDKGSYDFGDTRSSALSVYRLTLPVRGSYPQVRQFIENTLASIPAIALESLRLDRSAVSDEIIAADLEFAILVGNGL